MWHLRAILIFGTYIVITCYTWCWGAINDTIAFLMLRWLLWVIFVAVLLQVLASVSCTMTKPLKSCDADATGITWPKNHVASHFICLNIRNAVVPLMMLLASCDIDVSASDIKWLKCHVAPHFKCLDLRNGMLPLTTLSAWCHFWCQWFHMTKSCYTSFLSSWPKEYIDSIGSAVQITCWHQRSCIIWHQ